MAVPALALPIARATDVDGNPLPGALLHFYRTGTSTPVSVYTTSALNVEHQNPVVADGGGKFAAIFPNPAITYRAVLTTAGGTTVFDLDPVTAPNASSLYFTPSSSGAVGANLETYLDLQPLFVESFRDPAFVGTATNTVDRQTVAAALTALGVRGGRLLADPGRTYDFGQIAPNEVMFTLLNWTGAPRIFDVNGASLTWQSTTSGGLSPIIFRIDGCECGVQIENGYATDSGYDPASTKGAKLIEVWGDNASSRNIQLRNFQCYRMVGGFTVKKNAHRIIGLTVHDCLFEEVYYPANFQENGDGARLRYAAVNCPRIYLPYGVSDHEFDVYVIHDGVGFAGQQPVLLKRYSDDSSGIRGRITFGGVLAYGSLASVGALVCIEPQPISGSAAFNAIDLEIIVQPGTTNPNAIPALALQSYISNVNINLEDSTVFPAATANGSAVITPAASDGMVRFKAGQEVVGPGIPFGATIETVGATTLMLTANAAATAAAASLQIRTANTYGRIKLSGDLQHLDSAIKIVCRSIPKTAAIIALDPGLVGVDPLSIDAENIRFKVAFDREFQLMRGDLSLRAIRIPLTRIAGGSTILEASIFAINNTAAPNANMGLRRYDLTIFNLTGMGGIGITATERSTPASPVQNTGPTLTWGGNPNTDDDFINLTCASDGVYDNAHSLLRCEIHWTGSVVG